MKNNCEIIRDLLPLYCDNVCSEASKKLVEEHIDECAECRNEALKIKSEFSSKHIDEEKTKSQIFKKIKKSRRACRGTDSSLFCEEQSPLNREIYPKKCCEGG